MKPLPLRKIARFVDVFVEACKRAPDARVVAELEGAYGIDKDGEMSLAGLAEDELPDEIALSASVKVSVDRSWESVGMGRFKIVMERPAG
jgi:hypothetical protein